MDAWLTRHKVAVTAHDDAYAACVHLLTRYSQIPELALVGTDWLPADEFELAAFIRHTWPRTLIVLYGDAPGPVAYPARPLVLTYVGCPGLDRLCAEVPAELAVRACAQLPRLVTDERGPGHVSGPLPRARDSAPWPPRTLVSPEELAWLADSHPEA